jgi:hypothetical protein
VTKDKSGYIWKTDGSNLVNMVELIKMCEMALCVIYSFQEAEEFLI